MTEIEIIDNINKGDLSVFRWLYTQYYAVLCVYAKRFTHDKEIAEEVVQDVFLKLWEQHGRFTITDSVKAYLFASVRNRCLDHLKHLQIVHRYTEYYTHLLREAEDLYLFSQESGESVMIANEFEKSVFDAIESLPEQCHRIFTMSRFEGLRHQDIAEKLGVTLNTVQKQMSIALDKLREKLGKLLTLIIL